MSATSVKILTVGSAAGSIRDLFAKIKAINAKHGKFDFVLCVGDFFGGPRALTDENTSENDEVSQLLAGELESPLECYIMQGDVPLPETVVAKFATTGGELCKNVFLLSKSAVLTTAHGLRLACLGGAYDPASYHTAETAPGFLSPLFAAQTVDRLLSNSLAQSSAKQDYRSLAAVQTNSTSTQLVDILLTNSWPAAITRLSNAPLPRPELMSNGAPPLDEVVKHLKPRYHFAACGGSPPVFWEREPYAWAEPADRVSRFVSLGAFGGLPTEGKKQRWFYAFSIAPLTPAAAAAPKPANLTKNPFTDAPSLPTKRPFEPNDDSGANYIWGNVAQPNKRTRVEPQGEPGMPPPGYRCHRCDSTTHFIQDCPERPIPKEGFICKLCNEPGHFVRDCPTKHAVGDTGGRKPKPGYVCRACGSEDHYIEDCPSGRGGPRHSGGGGTRGRGRGPPKEITTDECWFCLSNPNIAKHLIVAIGTECYVSLPKGQLIPTHPIGDEPRDALVDVPGGGHVLIIPITHYPTFHTIPADLAPAILEETEKYKYALRSLYAKHGAAGVFFEVARLGRKGGHAHVQCVPVPRRLGGDGADTSLEALSKFVETAFKDEGAHQGLTFEEDADAALEACAGGAGGYFRVDLPDGRKMVYLIRDHVPFGVQFGRQVMANLLGRPERMEWQACVLSDDEDTADAKAFREAFAPFNPVS
ncbi:CwfJ C-terminus 1-domain-containing protein-like protein [Schizophyllum commune]